MAVSDIQTNSISERDLERIDQFLFWDIVVCVASTWMLGIIFYFFRVPFLLIMATEVALNAVLLVYVSNLAHKGRLEYAISLVAVGILIITATVGIIAPVLIPVSVLLAVLAAVLALPYISGKTLVRLIVAAALVSGIVVPFGQTDGFFGGIDVLPGWVAAVVLAAFVPAINGLIFLLLWQYSDRLTDTITEVQEANEALRESERSLELRVEERTAELRQANEDLILSQTELASAEARVRMIVETALDAVITMDSTGVITDWDAQAEVIFGWTSDEAVGRKLSELIIPEPMREAHEAGLQRFMNTGVGSIINKRLEFTALDKLGNEFPIEISIAPVRMPDSYTFSAFVRDITERRRYERALRESQMEATRTAGEMELLFSTVSMTASTPAFETALKQTLDLVCNYVGWPVGHALIPADDDTGVLVSADIWHLDDEQFKNFVEVTRPKRFGPGEGLPGQVMRTGEAVWIVDLHTEEEFPSRPPARDVGVSGAFGFPVKIREETVAVLEFFNPEPTAQDTQVLNLMEVVGYQMGLVLERQRAYQALGEAQEQLVRAERLAAIGELAAGVAHELRNPLGGMKNAAFYLGSRLRGSELLDQNPRMAQVLEVIDQEIDTSNQIITDLMDYSRVRSPDLVSTEVGTLLDNAIQRIEIKDDVSIVREISPNISNVMVDPEQMRRAFGNLIKNADEAMLEGGILTISASETDGQVEIRFSDTGPGIERENLEKVLTPLFTTKTRGIGMGLAIVNTIVERHEGTIRVDSAVGAGTTFTVTLPAAPASAQPA